MEGRFENFTLGRNIEIDKVKEMYRLFQKHGLQLEGMRSFGRYVTDEELEEKRALASELRQHPDRLDSLITAGPGSDSRSRTGHRVRQRVPWIVAGVGAAAVALAWLLSQRHALGRRMKRERPH